MFDNIYGFYFPVLRSRYFLLGVYFEVNVVNGLTWTWLHRKIHGPNALHPNQFMLFTVMNRKHKKLLEGIWSFLANAKTSCHLSVVTQHHKRTTECRNSSGILPWPSSQTGSAGRGQIRSTTLQLPLSIVAFLHDFPSSSIHMAFTCLPQQKPVIHFSCPPPRQSFHDTS